jgi:RHS repeat-associated protein
VRAQFVKQRLKLEGDSNDLEEPVARFCVVVSLTIALTTALSNGQAPPVPGGFPPFNTFSGDSFATVNLANLNTHFEIPLRSLPGRGIPFNSHLDHDIVWGVPTAQTGTSNVMWAPAGSGSSALIPTAGNFAALGFAGGIVFSDSSLQQCVTGVPPNQTNYGQFTVYSNFRYFDGKGTAHYFDSSLKVGSNVQGQTFQCPYFQSNPTTAGTGLPTDGSSYQLHLAPGAGAPNASVTDIATGIVNDKTDSNGNANTFTSGNLVDSSGNSAMSVTGTTNSTTFAYTGPDGLSKQIVATLTSKTAVISIGCPNVPDPPYSFLPGYPYAQLVLTQLALPDGSSYTFTYDSLLRPKVITLRTGGQITYNYNGPHNGMSCEDGGTSGFTKTTPDGMWTYSRTYNQTTQLWTTTVTDPQGNQSKYTFGGGSAFFSYSLNASIVVAAYEIQRLEYQKVGTSQVLMRTTVTCYNGSFTNCATNPLPSKYPNGVLTAPYQKDVYTTIPGVSGSLVSETKFSNGVVTEDTEYDFGAAAALPNPPGTNFLTTRTITPGTFSCPQSDVTTNSAGALLAKTSYICDTHGHPTSESRWTQGSTYLTTQHSYFSTGLLHTTTDPNGSVTTYTNGACNGAFPTLINEPLGLSRSMTWNCSGEVPLSVTDENNQVTTYGYVKPNTGVGEPFWRLSSTTDQLGNVTTNTYTPTTVESVLPFNSNASAVDVLTTLDSLGRPAISQKRQAPGSLNFDTTSTSYDSLGRVSAVSMPCVKPASQPCPSTPATTTTYDALSRPLLATDGGNGTTKYDYLGRDVLLTIGPASTGPPVENTKRRQMEFDALGRLTSVCEITAGTTTWPGASCAQATAATGYLTRYNYSVIATGPKLTVTQNAQSGTIQTRSFSYDLLGRLISEANPETGTTTYVYDTDTLCGTFKGDRVKRTDAAANVTCYAYDALHRQLSSGYMSGPNSGATPDRFFVYDNALINGSATMANAKGRLAEAYTCFSCPGTKLTDVGFSYNGHGETTDSYEWRTHSAGYYHTSASYWPHGLLKSLGGLPVMPTIYYGAIDGTGLDGEGRVTQVTPSAGQNPVTAVTYTTSGTTQPIGSITHVAYGSGDSDDFSYDTNTGRMNQYQFHLGAQANTGTLTWNSNGTLQSLGIADQINPSGNQTCNYLYDDMQRIASASCGTMWSQTFTYDPFGNVKKTGSLSYLPNYSTTTNRDFSISYDAIGNTLNDGFHTYSWDAEAQPVVVDGNEISYDALGRMVELHFSWGYNEWVHAPTGKKIAMMLGSTFEYAYIPLPGGGLRLYQPTGGQGYAHRDWLGSSRLVTSDTRTLISDVAYAPFGEDYAAGAGPYLQFTSGTLGEMIIAAANGQGLFDFDFRKYSPRLSRWLSPDPAGLAVVDPTVPQSWNRYAYVLNNPLSAIDPLGTNCVWDDGSYEADDDPAYGNSASGRRACGNDGGTWMETVTGDWNGNPNQDLAWAASEIQQGYVSASVTGSYDSTYFLKLDSDCGGRATRTLHYSLFRQSGPEANRAVNFNVIQYEEVAARAYPGTRFGINATFQGSGEFTDGIHIGIGRRPGNSNQTFFASEMLPGGQDGPQISLLIYPDRNPTGFPSPWRSIGVYLNSETNNAYVQGTNSGESFADCRAF